MSDVVVCIPVFGSRRYQLAGRQAALSVLQHTDFDLFLACDPGRGMRLSSSRVQVSTFPPEADQTARAAPFLRKFVALDRCLQAGSHRIVICLDADAVFVRHVDAAMLGQVMQGRPLAMAVQDRIRNSKVDSAALLQHYRNFTLAWFAPGQPPAMPNEFRFYNSGVVAGQRAKLREIADWALARIAQGPAHHNVGEHMIADQDYYQYWVHALDPGCCAQMPWQWNHCQHWDDGFPRAEALILHFSFFCLAPALRQIAQMTLLRNGHRRAARVLERLGGSV